MRTKLGFIALVLASVPFYHCGGGDDSTGAQAGDAGANDSATTDGSPSDGGAADSASSVITVSGTLLNSDVVDGGTLANRDVVIIDANGTVTKTTSDTSGAFGATGVKTPYDIGVPWNLPDSGSTIAVPEYYAGISRANPIVRAPDYSAGPVPDTTPRSATVTVTVSACPTCHYVIAGSCGGDSTNGTGSPTLNSFPCDWQGAAAHTATYHIYVTDGTGAYISGVDIPMQSFNAGDTVALGTPTLLPITNATVAYTATVPAGYSFNSNGFQVATFAPDGVRIGVSSVQTLTGSLNFPFVPALNVQITSTASDVATDNAEVDVSYPVGSMPATITTNLLAAPTLSPPDATTGVTNSQSLSWTPFGVQGISQVAIFAGTTNVYAFTAGTSVDLGRLEKAEMGLLPATKYKWEVAVSRSANQTGTMDELIGPASTGPTTGVQRTSGSTVSQTFTTQ